MMVLSILLVTKKVKLLNTCIALITIDSFMKMEKKNYPQVYLEECKCKTKKIKMANFINTELESESEPEWELESETEL